jgi:hypothetical protein
MIRHITGDFDRTVLMGYRMFVTESCLLSCDRKIKLNTGVSCIQAM